MYDNDVTMEKIANTMERRSIIDNSVGKAKKILDSHKVEPLERAADEEIKSIVEKSRARGGFVTFGGRETWEFLKMSLRYLSGVWELCLRGCLLGMRLNVTAGA